MFSNLNIDNADLKYISLKIIGDDIEKYSDYSRFTIGLSRLNPLSILDFFKLVYNRRFIDDDVYIHTCDFHSVALALHWKIGRPNRNIVYANHDAIPHSGYSLIRQNVIVFITWALFMLANEVEFFSVHNKNTALKKYPFLKSKSIKVVPLPSPAEKYPIFHQEKKDVLLAFGRDSEYKMDKTYLYSLERLVNAKSLELRKVGGIADNLLLAKLKLTKSPIEIKGYVEEEILIKHCDESKFVLLNYRDISQSGIVQFARTRKCNLITNEKMVDFVETVPGDIILTKFGWYEC